jgi:hypothetical protein
MKKIPALFMGLILSLSSPQALAADEYPTMGLVYNTKEDASITYSCTKVQNGILECEFIQTAVRKKTKAEDLKKKLEDAKKQLPDALKEISSENSCDWMSVVRSVIEGRQTPEQAVQSAPKGAISDVQQFIHGMKEMSQSKKQDLLAGLGPVDEFCKTKSEESYLKIAKFNHEKEMRTCRVSSHSFKQSFKWVDDYSGKGAWVVDAKPSGPCGVIQLDRFEEHRTDSKLVFWTYLAKKAITNPKGQLPLSDLTCDGLDQDEYLYDWKQERDAKLGCEYIEFSPY